METITVSKERYETLLDIEHRMQCLDQAGIDNTDAYAEGMKVYRAEKGEED